MGAAIYWLISNVIFLFQLVLIIYIVTRILIQFGVVNSYNQVVQFILQFGGAIVEPVLAPIRKVIPLISGIDLSPIVLLLGLGFFQRVMFWLLIDQAILGG